MNSYTKHLIHLSEVVSAEALAATLKAWRNINRQALNHQAHVCATRQAECLERSNELAAAEAELKRRGLLPF